MDWKDKEDLRRYFRHYMRNYKNSPHGRKIRGKAILKYRLTGKEKKQIEAYRKNNPKIRKAHTFVERLLKKGLLKPSHCTSCKKLTKAVAHHPNYNFPNIFTWLCRLCHSEIHRKLG